MDSVGALADFPAVASFISLQVGPKEEDILDLADPKAIVGLNGSNSPPPGNHHDESPIVAFSIFKPTHTS